MSWACLTLELIRAYSCGAYPGGGGGNAVVGGAAGTGSVQFTDVTLDGRAPTAIPWKPVVANTDDGCSKGVSVDAGSGDVRIVYNSNGTWYPGYPYPGRRAVISVGHDN